MKKIMCFLMVLGTILSSNAQSLNEKGGTIALSVIVEDLPESFPATAKVQLTNKLNMLITKRGIASADAWNRFFITAIATPLTKDIVPGPPAQIAQNMEIVFYIADYYDQKIFSSTSVTTKGVGTNETKSYMDAIKRVNINASVFDAFIKTGKEKIIDYYEKQAELILAKAKNLAQQKQYEEAMYLLTSIPTECSKYQAALNLSTEIYQQYIDYLCDVNLALAKTTWAAEQNALGASDAGQYLALIYPDAKCYGEAQNLYKEIKGKVLDDWKFEMKKYQDTVDLESQRINAMREIGVAYGKGQQPTTTNIAWLH